MREHERVLRELVDLVDRLDELPDDAFEERAVLHARQSELRQRAAELRIAETLATSQEEARRELDRLEGLLTRIITEDHIRMVPATEGGGPGGFVGDAMALNHLIDTAEERGKIERQIRLLRTQLEQTG